MRKAATNKIIRRAMIVFLLMLACIVLVIIQLVKVQIVDFQKYQSEALKQQTRDKMISPMRGTIYDATGNALAKSAPVETVIIAPVYFAGDTAKA